MASASFSLTLVTRDLPNSDCMRICSNRKRHSAECVRVPMPGVMTALHPMHLGVGPCSSTSFFCTYSARTLTGGSLLGINTGWATSLFLGASV